jgi:hypothetical protein
MSVKKGSAGDTRRAATFEFTVLWVLPTVSPRRPQRTEGARSSGSQDLPPGIDPATPETWPSLSVTGSVGVDVNWPTGSLVGMCAQQLSKTGQSQDCVVDYILRTTPSGTYMPESCESASSAGRIHGLRTVPPEV